MATKGQDKKSTPDGRLIDDFEKRGQHPLMWYYQADKLRKASEAVYGIVQEELNAEPPVSYFLCTEPIYRYLTGMAIENLLKGIMVCDDPGLVQYDVISEELDGHNVWTKHTGKARKKVGDKCRLSEIESELTKNEQEFMRDLEPYVNWMGRYGIPKKRGTYETDLRTVNSKPDVERFRGKFSTIYDKIHPVLDKKLLVYQKRRREKKK
jgi:hypothetical protein